MEDVEMGYEEEQMKQPTKNEVQQKDTPFHFEWPFSHDFPQFPEVQLPQVQWPPQFPEVQWPQVQWPHQNPEVQQQWEQMTSSFVNIFKRDKNRR